MPQLTEQSLHLVQSWRCDRETPEKCLWVQAEFKPVYPIITYIYIFDYIRQKYAKQWLGHKVEFSAIGSDHLPKAIHRALWQP